MTADSIVVTGLLQRYMPEYQAFIESMQAMMTLQAVDSLTVEDFGSPEDYTRHLADIAEQWIALGHTGAVHLAALEAILMRYDREG